MKSEEAKRLKQLEGETHRPKKFVADPALDIQMLKDILKGSYPALCHDVRPWSTFERSFLKRIVVPADSSISCDRRNDSWDFFMCVPVFICLDADYKALGYGV